MPELPEVQAHAERLSDEFAGAPLERFEPLSFTVLRTALPDPAGAYGRPLDGITRRGKLLLVGFGDLTFVVHPMQGGRLRPDTKLSAKPRNGIARWRFADGRALLLTEPGTERKAGVWVVEGDPLTQTPLDDLGIEADQVTEQQLADLLASTSMRLHGFLRDQHHLAGIGRRLANEICHRARLSPFATTSKLSPDDVGALHRAIADTIADSLAFDRAQSEMVNAAERPGAVHHRTGEACPVCDDTVRAIEYRAYTVSYCPTCQTGGKVLADNTTSRFLK
ncbi:MAG: DNA-formamidopyrimidine glycosylase family protein [Acidimicrobiales bacterium]